MTKTPEPTPLPHVIQPRRVRPLQMAWVGALLVALFVWTMRRQPPHSTRPEALRMNGLTMGTTWSIRIADREVSAADLPALRAAVEAELAEINRQMSAYDPASEISRFNHGSASDTFSISPAFASVVRFALELAARSDGAFDPTVGPLIALWGFGRDPRRAHPPSDEEIAQCRTDVGHRHLTLTDDGHLVKRRDRLHLDLNAVAKGHGVDVAARALSGKGLRHFFVEVGGEVVARGERPGGGPWRIGVDRPHPDAPPGADLQRVLHLTDIAVATSGDYRNFFRDERTGEVFTHIFDPRTGRPARGMAGSVTVVADTCLKADGLATALFVMGPDAGLVWLADAYPEADALFILRRADGALEERATAGFDARTR
jgi:thiamine biosynthesis lipoprotein